MEISDNLSSSEDKKDNLEVISGSQNPDEEKEMRFESLKQRVKHFKPTWDKDATIEYKTEHIAILNRNTGYQVEFIIAFDDLTKEGYRLVGIDSSGDYGDGYFFQKMKYVR